MTIKDKTIEPYSIQFDGNNYNVLEDTGRTNKEGDVIMKNHAYCNSVSSALVKIGKLKTETSEASYTINDYVTKIKKYQESIKSLIQ